ncbi:hypothetical protein F5I97DRAFT_1964424 [Phlebopus sp. FC_14]|nr:hypothetical protein F5I97DRAFT_1964424 [Phlebopus sp. FC_14]
MEHFKLHRHPQRSVQSPIEKPSDDIKPPFQLKFSSQVLNKTDSQGIPAFSFGPQRSQFSLTQNSKLHESGLQRSFDVNVSSFHARHAESLAPGSSAYPHTPDRVDRKPILGMGRLLQPKQEAHDVQLNPHTYGSSRASTAEYVPNTIKSRKEETNSGGYLTAIDNGAKSDDPLCTITVKYCQLQEELAKQRDYTTALESQLAMKSEDNASLMRSIAQTKAAHKEALEKVAKNFSDLKTASEELKRRADSSSTFLCEARSTMQSIVELRDHTTLNIRGLESMFDDDGKLIFSHETRAVVQELRLELVKTQQVADLLRDKLHSMATELAEARARISELEGMTAGDRQSVESATLKLCQSADQMAEITSYLKEQKHESVRAATMVYETEQQLTHARARLQEAESMIKSMREEMAEGDELQKDQKSQLRVLRNTMDFQEQHMKDLEARARKSEDELSRALNRAQELQARIDIAKDQEKSIVQQNSRLLSERDGLKDRLHLTERKLEDAVANETILTAKVAKYSTERDAALDNLKALDSLKREIELYRAKYSDSQVSLKVLQERFDDQSVTLAASKETISELQERLSVAEHRTSGALLQAKRDVGHLQEQKELLQAKLDETDRDIKQKGEAMLSLQLELSRREGSCQTLLEGEKQRANEAHCRLHEMNTRIEALLTELAQKDRRVEELDKRLAAAEAPSAEHEREVTALEARVGELEASEKQLLHRAMTITHRYKESDLNDDEKTLVATLMQKARAIHDREMVEKNNDIKRRDNIIKQHEARISQLEDNLARRIYDEPQIAPSPGAANDLGKSMANAATNPPAVLPAAPHVSAGPSLRDIPAAADAVLNAPISAPSSRSSGHANFANLCKEDSDDIFDFDEEKLQSGKRVMFADSIEDEVSRPSRRAKLCKVPEVEKMVDKIPGTSNGANAKKKAPRRR